MKILNIPSLSEHEKYAELADNTKTLLCIPVMNGSGNVVALIFAFNKLKNPSSESFFSSSDVNIAQVSESTLSSLNLNKSKLHTLDRRSPYFAESAYKT